MLHRDSFSDFVILSWKSCPTRTSKSRPCPIATHRVWYVFMCPQVFRRTIFEDPWVKVISFVFSFCWHLIVGGTLWLLSPMTFSPAKIASSWIVTLVSDGSGKLSSKLFGQPWVKETTFSWNHRQSSKASFCPQLNIGIIIKKEPDHFPYWRHFSYVFPPSLKGFLTPSHFTVASPNGARPPSEATARCRAIASRRWRRAAVLMQPFATRRCTAGLTTKWLKDVEGQGDTEKGLSTVGECMVMLFKRNWLKDTPKKAEKEPKEQSEFRVQHFKKVKKM